MQQVKRVHEHFQLFALKFSFLHCDSKAMNAYAGIEAKLISNLKESWFLFSAEIVSLKSWFQRGT